MSTFDDFLNTAHSISDLETALSVLGWDQETYMPPAGATFRAEQLATLSTLAHRMRTSSEYRSMIDELSNGVASGDPAFSLDSWQRAIVRESAREASRSLKLPESHVANLARATARSHESWKISRAQSDFSKFESSLAELVELKRNEAEFLGYEEDPYDALIDLYEPGMRISALRPVFDRLRDGTLELLQTVHESGVQVNDSILYESYDRDLQLEFARAIVRALGFEFDRGRVDLSTHPFCTSFSADDVRLTTRIEENDLRSCLFGLIHEAGHGMYEQGIDPRLARTVAGSGVSMGMHESQSLLWENVIGRGLPFWTWAYPKLKTTFPRVLDSYDITDFYRAINAVKPSLIRIEADDLTYNLHIIIRVEIEHDLINGSLGVHDVPARWAALMHEYLGVVPPNDAEGCLQDVHWSFAGFGYFPSYTLGKLYAASFYQTALGSIANLEARIGRGEFAELREWLRSSIHVWGKCHSTTEIVERVTGGGLTEEPFLAYNRRKIELLYQ